MATSLAIRAGSFRVRTTIMHSVQLPHATDGQLIVRIAGGDRGAFDELHGRYSRAVLGLALRRLGDRGRAEDATQDAFGGVAELKAAVNDAGVKRFGSGWTWLVWDGTGLEVKSTPNQDTPVMDGQAPILGIDVWEHAYYLNYQNRRPDYLEAWWNVVDWDAVAAKFAAARG